MLKKLSLLLVIASGFVLGANAQNLPGTSPSSTAQVQLTTPYFSTIPISTSGSVSGAATLTIPAPSQSNYYNYVCSIAFQATNNNTGAVLTNVVTTNTNFGTFAFKVSAPVTNSFDTGVRLAFTASPAGGCVKSTSAATATTFVSPTTTNWIYSFYATYYQAP